MKALLAKLAQVRRDGLAAGDDDWPVLARGLIYGAVWLYALAMAWPA